MSCGSVVFEEVDLLLLVVFMSKTLSTYFTYAEAAFVMSLREAFGDAVIDGTIRSSKAGKQTFPRREIADSRHAHPCSSRRPDG